MRYATPRLLTMLALCAVASSCANRVETRLAFPPAADLAQAKEPPYPVEALAPCPAGTDDLTCPAKVAEAKWRDDVLAWGRTGWRQNARVCKWAVDLKMPVPKGYCTPK